MKMTILSQKKKNLGLILCLTLPSFLASVSTARETYGTWIQGRATYYGADGLSTIHDGAIFRVEMAIMVIPED